MKLLVIDFPLSDGPTIYNIPDVVKDIGYFAFNLRKISALLLLQDGLGVI
jgi:hypothetical protein